jgi:hypothetical protein
MECRKITRRCISKKSSQYDELVRFLKFGITLFSLELSINIMKLYTDIYFLCNRLIFWSATSLRVYLELREMDYIGALNFELIE